jgi:hypothetical protein
MQASRQAGTGKLLREPVVGRGAQRVGLVPARVCILFGRRVRDGCTNRLLVQACTQRYGRRLRRQAWAFSGTDGGSGSATGSTRTDGIRPGTQRRSRRHWRRDEFKAWATPYFKRGSAWAFKAQRRNVYFSQDRSVIWFDELLDTRMGTCQASGVMRRKGDSFEIVHYQLSMGVPNAVGSQVTRLIRIFEEKDGWKGDRR